MILIKEMEYKPQWTKTEILARDFHKGYEYLVVSYGVHPCAYIVLQEGQPYYNAKSYDEVDITCHGGCTFVDKGSNFKPLGFDNSYKVIGWDYGHYNDFSGTYLRDNEARIVFRMTKKWTTKEIIEECKQVIEQLYVLEHSELSYK